MEITNRTRKNAVCVRSVGVTVNVITSIPPDVDKAFAERCKERGLSRAALLRELILKELGLIKEGIWR